MALADLISRLEHEAQSRVETIQRDTAASVQAIETATEQAIAELTARRLELGHDERAVEQQRALARARRETQARELDARHAQIARIFSRARVLIPTIAQSVMYAAVLPAHCEEALSFLDGVRPLVRCQSAFAQVLEGTVRRHGAVLVINETVGPGVIAEAADGSVIVDNTLPARLARAEMRLAIVLARKLTDGA